MWADILTKPLQGQKFRDMHAFLQNCPRDYDDDAELKLSMTPQDVASSRECVDGHAKMQTKSQAKSRAKSPTCVSQVTWGPVTSIPHRDHADNMDRTKSYDRQESQKRAQIMNPTKDHAKGSCQRVVPKDRA
jgi:hypothetical protein